MHLLQLTNAPISSSTQAFIHGLVVAFEDTYIYTNGVKDSKALFPIGSLEPKASIGASMLKRKAIEELLAPIPEKSTVILTDPYSLQYLRSSDFEKYRFIQLLSGLQSSIQETSVKKIFEKRKDQIHFIALSERIASSWQPYLGVTPIPIIYPPYIMPREVPERESHQSFIVGIITPLIPKQGIETVLQALHRNREIIPQLTVIIVGDGPEKKQLHWLVDHLDLRRRVQFVSTMDQYHRFLPNFDVVVLPDEQPQGFNPVYLHAFAQGIPIVATSVGINEELVQSGQSGLLFEPRNSHVLAQHLVNLYNHPDWMEHYRKKGPEIIRDKFNLEGFRKAVSHMI